MSAIKLLSANMINKIAAGEVIERPASVVKELVENAIDAGAKRIEITIEKSGSDLIRIVDDGSGIVPDELPLALTSHATSKISESDDLFNILTLGFRGEALASIAEVSQLVLRSRVPDSPGGAEIRSDGGRLSEPAPCGTPVGTDVEVHNLFFNIPARRKFLKSPTTEFGHVVETLIRLSLPHPQIHFLLRHNGKLIHDLAPVSGMRERIERLFGSDLASRLVPVRNRRTDIALSGYVGHPDASRPNNNLQYLFLNGRFIKDRSLGHALSEAYRGLLPVGRYPVSFLELTLPPDFVDVNVHPTKNEVRFSDPGMIYSSLLGTIREEFLRSDLTSHPSLGPAASSDSSSDPSSLVPDAVGPGSRSVTSPQEALDSNVSDRIRNQVLDWAQGTVSPPDPSADVSPPPASPRPLSGGSGSIPPFSPYPDAGTRSGRLLLHSLPDSFSRPRQTGPERESGPLPPPSSDRPERDPAEGSAVPDHAVPDRAAPLPPLSTADVARTPNGRPVIHVHQRYLVFEVPEGMAVVDQHALHERILYEKIKARMEVGKLDSQPLLVPQAVDLSPAEVSCTLENRELLAGFGLLVDSFGGNTIIITGYPVIAERMRPDEVLALLLEPLRTGGQKPSRSDLLDGMMHQMACKAAVKAGNFLTNESISELLVQAEQEIQSHHCPHGRPSTLVFSCEELDKMFKRT